jgi:hypothetical protein
LDLNQSIVVSSKEVNLSQLIADYGLPAPLFEANGSIDISANTNYNVTNDINLYGVPFVQEIKTEIDLDNIRNNLSGKYILLNDITLNATLDASEGWLPIGEDSSTAFRGVLQGNGYKINGLWINKPSNYYVGLFGYLNSAEVKNIGVEIDNAKGGVKGQNYVGGIAGIVYYSRIFNVYAAGNVSGQLVIGGIAGYIYESSIANSYSAGNINALQEVGGIAGYVTYSSSVTNAYSTANVTGDATLGGIAAFIHDNSVVQYNVVINPSINGISQLGRIYGYEYNGNTISDNFALNTMLVGGVTVSDSVSNGVGRSEANLKFQLTYESLGWGFGYDNANPWKIDANKNNGFPYLYWEE